MKARLIKLTIITSFIFAFISCSSDGEVRDIGVTAVKSFYEPANGAEVALLPSESALLYFEWEPARAEDSGMVLYEIAFDKADGDFSNPLYVVASDDNGKSNYSSVSHIQINKIAAMAGIGSGQQGTLKWTVFSSKGINPVKAEKEYTFSVTRLPGFIDIPDKLYLTGEATESGADLSKALATKKIESGIFEIYTRLTEGKTFKFVNATSGTPKEYSLSGSKIAEGGTSTVSKTGIYKYTLNFNTGEFSTKEVTKVNLFLCWSQRKLELSYKANGVWVLNNYTITGLTGNDNTDDRYKFRMESSTGETEWRAINNDSKPTGNESYYYMVERTNVDQWTDNQIWKSPSSTGWSDKTYDITFSLNAGGPYTHNLVIKQ